MKVLIAGSSGLIGSELRRVLEADGHAVRVLVRRPADGAKVHLWAPEDGLVPAEAIAWSEALVNLSGAPLSRLPWTAAYRRAILQSRVLGTSALAAAVLASDDPPKVWLNASATGRYGHRPGEALTEASEAGSGFLAEVVERWEAATRPAEEATRVVRLRTGLVLASGGALAPLVTATRWVGGATIGSGTQAWPWISLHDQVAAIVHLMTRSELAGPVNLVGPTPATSAEVTRALAARLRRPRLWRVPAWLLRLGMGSAADELLLSDQRVAPDRLTEDGFVFAHHTVMEAVAWALDRQRVMRL